MRDLDRLVAAARKHGADVGIYAECLLDDKLPQARMRAVYRLLGLAGRYGDTAVNTACGKAIETRRQVDNQRALPCTPRWQPASGRMAPCSYSTGPGSPDGVRCPGW